MTEGATAKPSPTRRRAETFDPLGGLPKPTATGIALRGLRWAWAGARFVVDVGLDRLRGEGSDRQLGERVRRLFERVGGTAIKMGQQLSARSDLLPQEVCEALSKLNDDVPPLQLDVAMRVIAESLGQPAEEIFAEINPEPIGSASVACVYRARLHSGEPVAIKVQREGIAREFAEDLFAFNLCSRFMEWSTFVREGSFGPLRDDLGIMFGEEMDFRLESRYQRTFTDRVRSAGMPWVRAPRVFSELSRRRVLVMEFIEAVPMGKLIEAVEYEDQAALSRFAEMDIDPELVSFRIQVFSMWARFEAPFFHADPHAGNAFTTSGSELIFIDFGACGTTSSRTRRNHTEVIRFLLNEDANMMSKVMTSDVAPLPPIDIDDFIVRMRADFDEVLLALRDDNAHWSERVMSSLWLKLLENARDLGLRMNLDTVRAIRAFLLYDSLVARLNPEFGTEGFVAYLKDRAQRSAEAQQDRLTAYTPKQRQVQAYARAIELMSRFQNLRGKLGVAVPAIGVTYARAISTAARVALVTTRVLYTGCLLTTLHFAFALSPGEPGPLLRLLQGPLGVAIFASISAVAVARLRYDLNRVDADL